MTVNVYAVGAPVFPMTCMRSVPMMIGNGTAGNGITPVDVSMVTDVVELSMAFASFPYGVGSVGLTHATPQILLMGLPLPSNVHESFARGTVGATGQPVASTSTGFDRTVILNTALGSG